MFHYRKTTPNDEVSSIIKNANTGYYGRGFLHEKSGHWIEDTNLIQLPVNSYSEANFLISENGRVYYSYGIYKFPDGYEQ